MTASGALDEWRAAAPFPVTVVPGLLVD